MDVVFVLIRIYTVPYASNFILKCVGLYTIFESIAKDTIDVQNVDRKNKNAKRRFYENIGLKTPRR